MNKQLYKEICDRLFEMVESHVEECWDEPGSRCGPHLFFFAGEDNESCTAVSLPPECEVEPSSRLQVQQSIIPLLVGEVDARAAAFLTHREICEPLLSGHSVEGSHRHVECLLLIVTDPVVTSAFIWRVHRPAYDPPFVDKEPSLFSIEDSWADWLRAGLMALTAGQN